MKIWNKLNLTENKKPLFAIQWHAYFTFVFPQKLHYVFGQIKTDLILCEIQKGFLRVLIIEFILSIV